MIEGVKASVSDKNKTSGLEVLNWLSKNQTYVILSLVPLFSLASYLAFVKSKYNYFEHLVVNFYITGQQMIIYFILSFLFFKENYFQITPVVVGVIYNFWTFNQFFEKKKIFNKILLVVLTYFIFINVFFLFLFIITRIVKISMLTV